MLASWSNPHSSGLNDGVEETRILGKLAYNESHFDRAAEILVERALAHGNPDNRKENARTLQQLSQPYLSGTHASGEKRAGLIDLLIRSPDAGRQELGLQMLQGALKDQGNVIGDDYDFGAHARDYGWCPRNAEARATWYGRFLEIALSHRDNTALRPRIDDILANSIRGLWAYEEVFDQIDVIARRVRDTGFWPAGWLAARESSSMIRAACQTVRNLASNRSWQR